MSGWLTFVASFFCAGLSALGMGGGGLLLVYLTAYGGWEQRAAQGINLAFFIPVSLVAILFHSHKKLIRWQTTLPLVLIGLPGVWLGWQLAMLVEEAWLSKAFAMLLAVMGAREFFGTKADREEEQETA